MQKISSFTVNHLNLLPGLYLSRVDQVNDDLISTYDIRITRPNFEAVMSTGAIHALEHLGATFLRNHLELKDLVIYFGPMGCRTGFYLILSKQFEIIQLVPILTEMMEFIKSFDGKIPGASDTECGNYLDMDLLEAKKYANKYLIEFLYHPNENQMHY